MVVRLRCALRRLVAQRRVFFQVLFFQVLFKLFFFRRSIFLNFHIRIGRSGRFIFILLFSIFPVECGGFGCFVLHKTIAEKTALEQHGPSHSPGGGDQGGKGGGGTGTVSTYAAKLQAKSGTDLILAALLQCAKVDGKATLKRKDLLEAMKSAKTHYKATYSNNLSKYLESLVKSKDLNEVATDEYAISETKMKALEAQIAGT